MKESDRCLQRAYNSTYQFAENLEERNVSPCLIICVWARVGGVTLCVLTY